MTFKVYLVTGDDHLDDPAWGVESLAQGTAEEVRSWLQSQPSLEGLEVIFGPHGWPAVEWVFGAHH